MGKDSNSITTCCDYRKPDWRCEPLGAAIELPFPIRLRSWKNFTRDRIMNTTERCIRSSTSPYTPHLLHSMSDTNKYLVKDICGCVLDTVSYFLAYERVKVLCWHTSLTHAFSRVFRQQRRQEKASSNEIFLNRTATCKILFFLN